MGVVSWLDRDGRLIMAANGLRSFALGFVSIILAVYLQNLGFGSFQFGLVVTAALIGGLLFTSVAGVFADRIGRRKTLALFGSLMALAGFVYSVTANPILLTLGTLVGILVPSGGEVPNTIVEEAMLPQTCPTSYRNSVFAWYNTVGNAAESAGTLFSALPVFLTASLGIHAADAYRSMFAIFLAISAVTAVMYGTLSKDVETRGRGSLAPGGAPRSLFRLAPESRARIARLSFWLGIDSFASGLVFRTILTYWFLNRFGVPLVYLSVAFFASSILSSASFIAAGKLADRIGQIRTMVFTHLPSNLLLVLMALAPTAVVSLALYLGQSAISQMDVPARGAYIVSIVGEEERTLSLGVVSISRSASAVPSPSISGYLLQFVSLSIPFYVAGALRTVSDVAIFLNFRKIRPRDEEIQT